MEGHLSDSKPPAGIKWLRQGRTKIVIQRNWARPMLILPWLGSVLFFSSLFLFTELLPNGWGLSDVMYGMFLLGILILFNYSLIAGVFNRTVVSADHSKISAVNEPLPWFPFCRELPMSVIKRFVAKERFFLGFPTAVFPSFSHYGVVAQLENGDVVNLVGGNWTSGNWASKQQAEYLAESLQRFLQDCANTEEEKA